MLPEHPDPLFLGNGLLHSLDLPLFPVLGSQELQEPQTLHPPFTDGQNRMHGV